MPSRVPAPPPPAREAGNRLHPRYQGVWEERDKDWPDDEPWEVDVDLHDFTERRWLTAAHRAALDAGELEVPERTNSDHAAVLVSIPDLAEGTPVAWVDRGVAEVVYHAARLGAPTAESCENAGGPEGHYGWPPDMPMLWFHDEAGLHRFAGLVEDVGDWRGWHWFYPWRPRWWKKPIQVHGVAIPPADLPELAAYLRRQH